MHIDSQRGVTLIELLLVIAIIAIISAASTPFLSRFILQVHFDNTVEKVISTIRKAQEYAMDGKGDVVWGICQAGNVIRLFAGSCASPATSENFSIPGTISVSGLSEISFNSRGEPTENISIVISSSTESTTIEINIAGGITIN